MIVRVTKKDIRESREHFANGGTCPMYHCPVAKALKRITGGVAVEVRYKFVFLNGRYVDLPLKAVLFVKDFDAGRPCKPCTFELPD